MSERPQAQISWELPGGWRVAEPSCLKYLNWFNPTVRLDCKNVKTPRWSSGPTPDICFHSGTSASVSAETCDRKFQRFWWCKKVRFDILVKFLNRPLKTYFINLIKNLLMSRRQGFALKESNNHWLLLAEAWKQNLDHRYHTWHIIPWTTTVSILSRRLLRPSDMPHVKHPVVMLPYILSAAAASIGSV